MQMSGGNDTDFQLAGMSGPTRLDVEGVPEGWAVKAILLDGDDVTDEAFDLTGKTGNLRVVMTDRLTSLSGTVQSNSEIRDHNVLVFPDDATKWTSPSRFVRRPARTATAASRCGAASRRAILRGGRYRLSRGRRRAGPAVARKTSQPGDRVQPWRRRTALNPARRGRPLKRGPASAYARRLGRGSPKRWREGGSRTELDLTNC